MKSAQLTLKLTLDKATDSSNGSEIEKIKINLSGAREDIIPTPVIETSLTLSSWNDHNLLLTEVDY